MEMKVVHGPTVQLTSGDILYQVTLASGAVITSPSAFEAPKLTPAEPKTIVTMDGRVLVKPKSNR